MLIYRFKTRSKISIWKPPVGFCPHGPLWSVDGFAGWGEPVCLPKHHLNFSNTCRNMSPGAHLLMWLSRPDMPFDLPCSWEKLELHFDDGHPFLPTLNAQGISPLTGIVWVILTIGIFHLSLMLQNTKPFFFPNTIWFFFWGYCLYRILISPVSPL